MMQHATRIPRLNEPVHVTSMETLHDDDFLDARYPGNLGSNNEGAGMTSSTLPLRSHSVIICDHHRGSNECSSERAAQPPLSPSTQTTPATFHETESHLSHRRFQRRLSEAAQFYDTVGELPPPCELERFIEDDDEIEDNYSDAGSAVIDLGNAASEGKDDDETATIDLRPRESASESSSRSSSPLPAHPMSKCATFHPFVHRSPGSGSTGEDYHYRGLAANPPDMVYQGMSRGNYSSLHRKAWLESADKQHRYGKNLRLYYRHWESLGCPTNVFFDWLDSKGESEGWPLPELEDCPRSQLDHDTVLYITDTRVTQQYALQIKCDDEGRGVVWNARQEIVRTGPEGWIFVLRDGVLYGSKKVYAIEGTETHRFHHSSFFGGKAVAAAGIFVTDANGVLQQVFPHSGHYRPGDADVQRMLFFLYKQGVDLRSFDVDIQLLIHIDRQGCEKDKRKKLESLHLRSAMMVALFLSHKARTAGLGIFEQLESQRSIH